MNTTTLHDASASPARPALGRIYTLEAKLEFLKVLRLPAFALPTIAFPVLFYAFFGLTFSPPGGFDLSHYLLATYGAFGVIGASLFGFGVGVAIERGQGWMLLRRASPAPPSAYFVAKLGMAFLFSTIIVALLYGVAIVFGGVEMALARWALLAATLVLGSVPFCAMGLALGYWCGPNSAPAVVNLIYLPMGFLSGLWIPLQVLPETIQKIATMLPAFHFAQVALKVIDMDAGSPLGAHLAYLAIFSLLSLALARLGYRRDEDKTYG